MLEEQAKTNSLLAEQNQLLRRLLPPPSLGEQHLTHTSVPISHNSVDEHTAKLLDLGNRKRYSKPEVMDMLEMSESTYKRNVKSGLLVPMRLNGIDEYFMEDLYKAMEESRRRGRV